MQYYLKVLFIKGWFKTQDFYYHYNHGRETNEWERKGVNGKYRAVEFSLDKVSNFQLPFLH